MQESESAFAAQSAAARMPFTYGAELGRLNEWNTARGCSDCAKVFFPAVDGAQPEGGLRSSDQRPNSRSCARLVRVSPRSSISSLE